MSLKENSPFWHSQLTVGQDLVLKKKSKSCFLQDVMAHMVLRQLRREAQKIEASQDYKFLKQGSVFKNKSKKGGSGGEVRKQEVSALGRYR